MKIEDCFYIGYITKTKGLKGEVQVYFEYEEPADLPLDSVFAEINGKLCAVDWKTVGAIGKAKSQAWQGAQLAAYAATVNRLWGLEITDAVNVHVGPDGYKLTTWNRADLLIAWKSFLECLQIHWGQKEGPDAEAAMASIRAEWLSEAA